MTVRQYTSRSQQTTLTSAVTSGGTTINVANATTLFATVSGASLSTSSTFTVVLDPDTALEEIVDVTGASSNTLTITRSADAVGTATDHSAGAVVRHMVIGRDLRDSNTHIEASSSVHALSATGGVVVGTAQVQTLTNKTLTTPIVAGATLSGTITSTATITGGTLTGAIVTGLSAPSNGSDATTKTYVDSILGSATAAATSAASAATSASSASTSASSAATSASSAATSASSALTSQTAAATSASSASTSASSAATSASSASTQATAASTSATSAAASATAASTSATSAAASATAASTSATSAAASATAAATSASSAATSVSSAAASVTAAATSAASAATSATSAGTSATAAATSATSAAASATAAATSASSAAASTSAAATSAASAATSASSAATSATAAASSATSAAASYDSFDDRYLGAKAVAPTVDNDGNALLTGALYWNTSINKMYVWSGTAWGEISSSADIIAYKYTVAGGATSVSGADDNALTLTYTVGKEQVYINGVLQVRGSDYTATTGSSITGMTALLASDIVTVLAFTAFSVANTYTQAEADAKFFQTANEFSAGKNKIINGDFGIWQRGTSFTNPVNGAYTSDRMRLGHDGTGGTLTVSQQSFTPGTAPVAGYESSFFYRYNWSVAQTGATTNTPVGQNIEDVRTFAGQTITVSFWAKADSSRTLTPQILQRFGSGGSSTVLNTGTAINITTSWARYSQTFTVASISGKTIGTGSSLGLNLNSGTLNAIYTFDIWGIQVEAGSIATPFQTATGTLAGELAACQRYYQRVTAGGAYGSVTLLGNANSTTAARVFFPQVGVRRAGSSTLEYANVILNDGTNVVAAGTITLGGDNTSVQSLLCTTTGLTQFRPYVLTGDNNTAGYVAISWEL
jgi:hypothetical protein